MDLEKSTIESADKLKAKTEQETSFEIEKSPEEIEQKMLADSEKEVNDFEKSGESELKEVEKKASADGLQVDAEDKSELEELNKESQEAKAELENEISSKEQKENNKKLEEKFGGFVKNRKEFYKKIHADATERAVYDKENALKDVESIQGYVEDHMEKIEKLRDEIDSKKSKIINRILEFRQIRKLKKKLAFQEGVLNDTQNMLAQKKELVDAYDYLISEEEKFASLMEEAQKENIQRDEKNKLEILEEEENRDMKNLIKKHNVFFIHDIVTADWKPSANNSAIDTNELDFNDQLDILHGLAPTISTSTLHENSKQTTFGKGSFGVLLSGGRILGGKRRDAGTVALGLKERAFSSTSDVTVEAIENAITRKSTLDEDNFDVKKKTGYNELIVENPEIAGVCVKWNDERPNLKEDEDIVLSNVKKHSTWDKDGVYREVEKDRYAPWWGQISDVIKRGLPLFILNRSNNTVRLMYDINIKNKSFKVTPKYKPEHINNMPGIYKQHLGKTEKRQASMRVFDKAIGLLTEDEKKKFTPDGTENDSRGLYNIH